jgi:DNA-binding NarL/FixJ family response regulator
MMARVSKHRGAFMKNSKFPTPVCKPEYPADIVCEFTVADHTCRIIKTTSADYAKAANRKHPGSEQVSEIANFTINGETYTVIESHSNGDCDEGTDLAMLLTGRELQIAALVAMGYPNKLVAHKLRISEWTVASYLRRIFSKLGVETRAAMTYRCAQLIRQCAAGSPYAEQEHR